MHNISFSRFFSRLLLLSVFLFVPSSASAIVGNTYDIGANVFFTPCVDEGNFIYGYVPSFETGIPTVQISCVGTDPAIYYTAFGPTPDVDIVFVESDFSVLDCSSETLQACIASSPSDPFYVHTLTNGYLLPVIPPLSHVVGQVGSVAIVPNTFDSVFAVAFPLDVDGVSFVTLQGLVEYNAGILSCDVYSVSSALCLWDVSYSNTDVGTVTFNDGSCGSIEGCTEVYGSTSIGISSLGWLPFLSSDSTSSEAMLLYSFGGLFMFLIHRVMLFLS